MADAAIEAEWAYLWRQKQVGLRVPAWFLKVFQQWNLGAAKSAEEAVAALAGNYRIGNEPGKFVALGSGTDASKPSVPAVPRPATSAPERRRAEAAEPPEATHSSEWVGMLSHARS